MTSSGLTYTEILVENRSLVQLRKQCNRQAEWRFYQPISFCFVLLMTKKWGLALGKAFCRTKLCNFSSYIFYTKLDYVSILLRKQRN
jgi:hypothetical protein